MLNNRLYGFNPNQPGGADQMIQTTAAPTEGSPYFGLGDVIVVPTSFSSVNRQAQAAGQHPDEPTSQEPPVDP